MFIIYPAIDIIGGSAVRLSQGDYARKEVYHPNPSEVAKRWESEGGEFIHVVDLEGAKEGKSFNRDAIAKICSVVSVPVQVGGGIRNMEIAEDMLSIGVSRVILGTAALANPEFVKEAVAKHGENLVGLKPGLFRGVERIHGDLNAAARHGLGALLGNEIAIGDGPRHT